MELCCHRVEIRSSAARGQSALTEGVDAAPGGSNPTFFEASVSYLNLI